ncbi:cytidine and dCMP deaminase domain-containing protein 1 isoform X2 [Megalops cyprinoides]|uniref:cytidine and dCMP deaminase domain-containing protein 1 isoform X2 n=1 Tax=Megalops cyprinoides TaxID=118141 RepID=UPI00186470F2|nr:cytidine and dCMP deaminase domain-containing protein 1 isoform X2 [Megalops cyprinoides]
MNNCQQMQIKSYSQGVQCCHLKSVDFCSSEGPTEFLEERTLDEMVSRQWLTAEKKAECLQMQQAAHSANVPLSVQIHIGAPSNKYYVSVYESAMKKYSQFGRVIVAYNSNTNTLNCPCAKLDTCCLHKFICTWHLFQVEEQLFGRGEKEYSEEEDEPLDNMEFCMNTMREMEESVPKGLAAVTVDTDRDVCEACTQTDIEVKGYGPRLSKVNLFTLLSLWMELFPKNKSQLTNGNNITKTRITGLVVVQDRNVIGLHCSSTELHVGQIAVVKHGPRLKGCDLYFSRKPCSTCLKMIINAGVSRISYWPGDPELSLLLHAEGARGSGADAQPAPSCQEAALDAVAAERLKSNSRSHICVLLQPLASCMQQFVEETSRRCDFLETVSGDDPCADVVELFGTQRRRSLEDFTRVFFVPDERRHRDLLAKMGLENFCMEPYFSSLRQHMRDLIGVLASVASSIPDLRQGYGFYLKDPAQVSRGPTQGLSQEIARHCIIQAGLLAYRTEDPKVGVGAVIWAEGKSVSKLGNKARAGYKSE